DGEGGGDAAGIPLRDGRVADLQPRRVRIQRDGGVAMEDADRAGGVQVHHAQVVHVLVVKITAHVPGDAAGFFDRHHAVGSVVDAAATVVGEVADHAAVADRHRPAVVENA